MCYTPSTTPALPSASPQEGHTMSFIGTGHKLWAAHPSNRNIIPLDTRQIQCTYTILANIQAYHGWWICTMSTISEKEEKKKNSTNINAMAKDEFFLHFQMIQKSGHAYK